MSSVCGEVEKRPVPRPLKADQSDATLDVCALSITRATLYSPQSYDVALILYISGFHDFLGMVGREIIVIGYDLHGMGATLSTSTSYPVIKA